MTQWGKLKNLLSWRPRQGYLKLIQQALRVRPDGLGAFDIPCGSYIFLNSPTHQRDAEQPFGNEDLHYIQVANLSMPEFANKHVLFQPASIDLRTESDPCFPSDRVSQGLDVGRHWFSLFYYAGQHTYLWSSHKALSSLWSRIMCGSSGCAKNFTSLFTIPFCQKPSLRTNTKCA